MKIPSGWLTLREFRREVTLRALREQRSVSAAAKVLGVHRDTVLQALTRSTVGGASDH